MKSEDLRLGTVYFMVTYRDANLTSPIVISFRYLGPVEVDGSDEGQVSGHHFEYLPAYHYEDDAPEPEATFFSEEQVTKLSDIDGLIAELHRVRQRLDATRDTRE